MQEVEISDNGIVMCPECGYFYDAEPGKIIECENCVEKFKVVAPKN